MVDEKAVVLHSRDVLESKHMPRSFKSWWKLYSSIGIILFLSSEMFIDNGKSVGISLLFLLAIVFGVIIFISRIKNRGNVDKAVDEICSMKFKLTKFMIKLKLTPHKFI